MFDWLVKSEGGTGGTACNCSVSTFVSITLQIFLQRTRDNFQLCVCVAGIWPFHGCIHRTAWEMTGNGMRDRGGVTCSRWPQVGLQPRAAAARTKPLYMGHTLYQQSYRGALKSCIFDDMSRNLQPYLWWPKLAFQTKTWSFPKLKGIFRCKFSGEFCLSFPTNPATTSNVWCLKICAGTQFVMLLKFGAVLSIICGFLMAVYTWTCGRFWGC